jgi:hypothetical protein
MGIRGELFSTRIGCEGRTYFFNVKENRMGDMFLTVVESKPNESEGFERRSIVIFKEDLPQFLKAFQGALDFMAEHNADAAETGGSAGGRTGAPTIRYPRTSEARTSNIKIPKGFSGREEKDVPKKRIVVRRRNSGPREDGAQD